ncbi:hypothetical protein ACFPU0_27995 [Pseudomonas sp. GCM10022186]|uniref:hypothetical protein n=1 Tax=Pseudomonas sp. GCM10022186 TaxID=3252650 RepID=UPI0036191FAD
MVPQTVLLIGVLLAEASLAADAYPPDVAQFIERRELCEHFRQEPWPEGRSVEEKERRAFIASQLERYCKGSDQAIGELKKKYVNNRRVTDRLKRYEINIEWQQ